MANYASGGGGTGRCEACLTLCRWTSREPAARRTCGARALRQLRPTLVRWPRFCRFSRTEMWRGPVAAF